MEPQKNRQPLFFLSALLCGLLFWSGCVSSKPKESRPAAAPVFSSEGLSAMDAAVAQAIEAHLLPGAVVWLERNNSPYVRSYGHRSLEPSLEPMTDDTVFDAASLTKVIATAPSIMILIQRGQLQLDEPVAKFWPAFGQNGKEGVTLRHLLTHTSGLRPGLSLTPAWEGVTAAQRLVCEEKLVAKPGELFRYSDINYIALGELVHIVSGTTLDDFAAREVFFPLGMASTRFNPPANWIPRIAPTERTKTGMTRGVVHDPTSRRMGGVAGHAGLFTTAADLAKFARMFLNDGRAVLLSEGGVAPVSILTPASVRLMTTVQTPPDVRARRGLGWDIDSPYAGPRGTIFPIGSYGHSGWTGTSIWIDPFSRTFLILLSNRNHPTEDGNVIPLRSELATLAAKAVLGFDFTAVKDALPPLPKPAPKSASTLNGIDVLKRANFHQLKGLRVGLITNHTGTDRERDPTIELLKDADGVQLVALFSPEHGIRGKLDTKVDDSVDELTGLPVHSLYGAGRSPKPEHLAGLDILVFDIQDIGCRFYTYISTLGLCMEAANNANLRFMVLDRVNPIGGSAVEGPLLSGETSFVAWHPIVVRHGMTIGELAKMFHAEHGWKNPLEIVPVEGWSRTQTFGDTGLPWINPSPNMRQVLSAFLYPGIGLLETTTVSVGRGTDTPFQIVGAPYIDDLAFARDLNALGLPGVQFIPVQFTPQASVHKNIECSGVQIVVTDITKLRPVAVGVAMATVLQLKYGEKLQVDKMRTLLVEPNTLERIKRGESWQAIESSWQTGLDSFKTRRQKYLLY